MTILGQNRGAANAFKGWKVDREGPKDCYARIKNFYSDFFRCAMVTLKVWDQNRRPRFSKFAHAKEFKVVAQLQFDTCKKMLWIYLLRFRRAHDSFARKIETKKKKCGRFFELIWTQFQKNWKSLRSPYKFALFFVFLPQTHCHPSSPCTTHSRKCGKQIVTYITSCNGTRPPFYPPLIPADKNRSE